MCVRKLLLQRANNRTFDEVHDPNGSLIAVPIFTNFLRKRELHGDERTFNYSHILSWSDFQSLATTNLAQVRKTILTGRHFVFNDSGFLSRYLPGSSSTVVSLHVWHAIAVSRYHPPRRRPKQGKIKFSARIPSRNVSLFSGLQVMQFKDPRASSLQRRDPKSG